MSIPNSIDISAPAVENPLLAPLYGWVPCFDKIQPSLHVEAGVRSCLADCEAQFVIYESSYE